MTNRALITFLRTLEGFADSGAAKLATLWFDELRFEVGPILNSRLISAPGGVPDFEEWKRRALTLHEPDLDEDVFQVIRGQWKSAEFAPPDRTADVRIPLLVQTAIERAVTDLETDLNQDGAHPLDIHKETSAARATLGTHLSAWLPVSHDVALVGGALERNAIRHLSSSRQVDSAHQTFCDVIAGRIPDFAMLTWAEIVGLRSHGSFKQFRSKIDELDEMLTEGETIQAGKLMEHLFQHALIDLAKLVRPRVPLTAAKAIIGNLPLGAIPINPVGIYFAAKDAAKEKKIIDQYGWAYFLIDFNDMVETRVPR